ncbi:Fibrillin-2 [Stylophora pistillata]|uniref:Fibrillin-2 n=1 Tax=Stylophora pistillata TaxID=50429 RepID=A0A2B4RR27_STYPI|nr:Fibrillin-2 [Stylophora pistillata]
MDPVSPNKQCRVEINIEDMRLEKFVFKKMSASAPHICDIRCGQEISCQSYNYNRKKEICELSNRTKEARTVNFRSAPGWFYIRRLNGRAPLGSILELPALSCQEIKASEGKDTISNKYWLNPTGNGKTQLMYCNMNLATGETDECKSDILHCDVNAKCSNTYGSYKCTCKEGYNGTGHECIDVDECVNYSFICGVNATCVNTNGSYGCICKEEGSVGDGSVCSGALRVLSKRGNYICELNNASDESPGSSDLQSKQDYTHLSIENPCSSSPCFNNGTCQAGYTDKGFRCKCPLGFTGVYCKRACSFDFEDGIGGWKMTGRAFIYQPTFGDNPFARNKSAQPQGDWWVGGAEKRPNESVPAGEQHPDGADRPHGTLTSPCFRIIGKNISFLIGGGCKVVRNETGNCRENMYRKSWDVEEFIGQYAQVRLVDESSGS